MDPITKRLAGAAIARDDAEHGLADIDHHEATKAAALADFLAARQPEHDPYVDQDGGPDEYLEAEPVVEVTSPLGTGYVSLDDAVASIATATNLDDDALRDSLLAGDILEVAGVEYALVRGEVSRSRQTLS